MTLSKQQGVATQVATRLATKRSTRLVASQLGSLPPGDHTDPSSQGLQIRVREKASGTSRTWLFRYRWRGEWVRLTFGHYPGTGLVEARETAQGFRKKLDEGIDPRRAIPKRRALPSRHSPTSTSVAISADKHSIDFLVAEFMERHIRPTRKRPEYAQAILKNNVLAHWPGRDARTIEPLEVIELLDRIVERGSKVMANRVAGLLSQLFKFGIHRRIVNASPVQLLYRPGGKEKPRERSLTEDELRAFLSNPDTSPKFVSLTCVLHVLLLTGQRRGELALARWSDIDFEEATWTIPKEHSKTGRAHIVPLTDWAIDELKVLKRMANGCRFVLPNEQGSAAADPKLLTRGVARRQDRFKKLKIEKFTAHDLRRTCRTGLARLKVAPHIAERVLNHAQEKIAGTYDVHDYLEEKREALEKWAAHLKGLRM